MATRSKDRRIVISASTWVDDAGRTWVVLGDGPVVDALIPRFLAAFDDGEAIENFNGWCIRADSLERDGYMHLRIGVHVERV